MSKKFFAVIIFALVLGIFAGAAFADDDYYIREEAGRRNIHLISIEQARSIAYRDYIQIMCALKKLS